MRKPRERGRVGRVAALAHGGLVREVDFVVDVADAGAADRAAGERVALAHLGRHGQVGFPSHSLVACPRQAWWY